MQVPFRVETAAGPTQHGVMTYTSEGRAEALLEVPPGVPSTALINLPALPFPVTGSPRIPLAAPAAPQVPPAPRASSARADGS